MAEGERFELSQDKPAGFRDRCNTIMRTLHYLFEAGAGGVEPPSVVLETTMFAGYTMLPDAQTPSRESYADESFGHLPESVLYLVLREGIEPPRPQRPAALQTAAIPFCHLSTNRDSCDIQLSKTKKGANPF